MKKGLKGDQTAPTPSPAPAKAAPAVKVAAPAVKVTAPASKPVAIPKVVKPAPAKGVDPEKVAKHMRRTRKGVLKFVADQGGQAPLGDMHDHSERRYFVGHRKFSQLMESLIADGLLDYDEGAGVGTLTDAGRAVAEG